MVAKLAFPRELRLLTPADYAPVFKQNHRVGSAEITILARQSSLSHPRLGLAVAKKQVKRAHERNRIKRLTRESFRLHQHQLPAMDFVVIARRGAAELENQSLFNLLDKLWCRYTRQDRNY